MTADQLPVFVKIEDHREVHDYTEVLRRTIDDTRKTIASIVSLGKLERAKLDSWRRHVAAIERALDEASHHMLEPERV